MVAYKETYFGASLPMGIVLTASVREECARAEDRQAENPTFNGLYLVGKSRRACECVVRPETRGGVPCGNFLPKLVSTKNNHQCIHFIIEIRLWKDRKPCRNMLL